MKKKLNSLLAIVISVFFLAGCSHSDIAPPKTFVLVHGAWQGAYVWDHVKQQLQNKGQKVIVVELPAHGNDNTSPANVSIDVYRNKVITEINGIKGKVVLVGHSMGGVVISAVAEKIPDRIEKLVYIGAFLPANGQSLVDLANTDAQSLLGPALIPSKDMLTLDIIRDSIINIFCQDGPDEVKALLLEKYRPEPAIPFTNPVVLTDANFGKVDKYYIHTLQDHAVGLDLQNRMAATAGITKIYSLNTGHSPFLSMPDEVTNVLLNIGRQ